MASTSDDAVAGSATTTGGERGREADGNIGAALLVEVPDVTSPEDELEPTTVDSSAGPGPIPGASLVPKTAPSPGAAPVAKAAPAPPVDVETTSVENTSFEITSTEITSTTLAGTESGPSLPLTLPHDVKIREAQEEPLDETEVRTLVTDSPPSDAAIPSTDRAPLSEPPDEDTVVGAARPPSIARSPLPRVGPTPGTASSKGLVLPELDADDDGKDDAYEADESVTLRGPARTGGTAPTVPGTARSAGVEASVPYEDDDNEAVDDADSVTKPAPKPVIHQFVGGEDAAADNAAENQTAVMPSSPYKPSIGTTPFVPLGPTTSAGVWVANAGPRRDDSDSKLRMQGADAYAGGERASVGALLPAARAQPGSGAQPVPPDAFASGPFYAGQVSLAPPPVAPTPSDGVATTRSGQLWLVAVVAGISLVVPLALFLALRSPEAQEPARTPAEAVPDLTPRGDGTRERVKPAPTPAITPSTPPRAPAPPPKLFPVPKKR